MMNRNLLLGSVVSLFLLLTSCNDAKLAKQLDGTWTGGYTVSYDDGSKEDISETLSFNYIDDRNDDNGTFVETLTGKMHLDDIDGIDGTITCQYRSRIEGRWEVLLGDLYLYYKMSSLQVDVSQNDISISFDNAMDKLAYEAAAMEYAMETYSTPKTDIAKEAKKEIYQSLFQQYKQNDEDTAFPNLKVSDTEMSFDTNDMGRMTFRKNGTSAVRPAANKDATGTDAPKLLTVQNVEYWDNLKPQGGNTYEPANMLDGNSATAWAVSLDNAGFDSDKLYGPTFTLSCKKLSHIVLRNGYAKNESSFKNNARASRIIFCNADHVSDENEAASYLYEGIVRDTPEPQILEVKGQANRNITSIQLIFPADGLRRGAKWNDLCISEVEFWGWD